MPHHTSNMSEETKSSIHRGRRVLVLANPDPGDSSSSDDDRSRRYPPQSSQSSLHLQQTSIPPSSPYRPSNNHEYPSRLRTDLPHHITSSHSNPTLSSPSSQSSNAVESTPPPSTPSQAAPPDVGTTLFTHDDGSAVNDRSELSQSSRIQKVPDRWRPPRRGSSHRPKDSEGSLHSPIPSCPLPSQERVIMVTYDCHAFTAVDVTPANSAAFVWERIFTELKIPDEDQSPGFAIYRTQVNRAAVGEALTNDSLLRLIREHGDGEGNLKFLVCHPHARVQEPPLPTSPVRSIPPPPPIFGPLVPRSTRRSQSSHHESISSEDPTGYEPSAVSDDFEDADNRSTMRPRQYLPNLPVAHSPQSTHSAHYQGRQPPSPVSARIPYSPPTDRRRQPDINTGAVIQPSHSTPALEDTLAPPRPRHGRRGSNAEEREKAPRDSERVVDRADVEWPLSASSMKSSRSGAIASDEMINARRINTREPEPTVARKSSLTQSSPRRRGVPRADAASLARPPQSSRKMGGRVAPANYYITWKAADGSGPNRPLRNTRSTEVLQNLPPPPPPLQPTPSRPQLHVAATSTSFIRPSEPAPLPGPPPLPVPRALRPLPPTQGASIDNANSEILPRPFPQPHPSPPMSAGAAAYLSPTQEPNPRPHSASPSQQRFPIVNDMSGHDVSRDRDPQRPLPSLHHPSHSASSSTSKFGETPFREDGYTGSALPPSLRAGPYAASPVRPSPPSDTPPRSPVSAVTSRPSTSTSSAFAYTSSGTMITSRQNSSSSGQETVSESTLRPDERDKVIWDFKARMTSQKAPQQSDPPVDSASSFDEYATATNELWSRRPLSQLESNASPRASPRPALEVITQNSHNSRGGTFTADYTLQPQPQPRLRDPRPREPREGHKSTFEEYTWAHRPAPEDVYERLEDFFPEHDLDKPVIEANSGGTSPTAADPSYGIAPNDRERFNNVRGKKSIRIVAEEHKKRLDRTSRAQSSYGNLLRRSTKLWGGHVEEVTTSQKKPAIGKPTPDVPAGGPGPRPIFKWVRGELIGKGTYGRVYLALNVTNGEMIAVKQVEVPTTASDKSDSRQASFVQALKLESETLKDLDHPHIVAYLGFEETPNFLSIFLEYVPGGSIGSCLRDHGKFDEEVTKSFAAQILDGLAYLHSKNIIHRDLKADNILVEKTGVCKISDFGISKRADDDQAAYTAMQGTVFWMAPEVIGSQKGKGYNSKVDIWSVGCVVLEMWAGRRPWPDEDFFTVMFKVSHEGKSPPIPADVILSDLAFDFKERCFAVHPDARASAAELIQHPYLKQPEGWVFNDFR